MLLKIEHKYRDSKNMRGVILKSKKRDEGLIASEILDICLNGAGKTRIIYQANLNSSKANQYLRNLIEKGLIEEIVSGTRTSYKTTQRGMELRQKYRRLQSEMDELHGCIFTAEA
jgi:predicted transcriptional regulator